VACLWRPRSSYYRATSVGYGLAGIGEASVQNLTLGTLCESDQYVMPTKAGIHVPIRTHCDNNVGPGRHRGAMLRIDAGMTKIGNHMLGWEH